MVMLLNAIFHNLNKYIDCLSFQDKSFLNENHRRKAIGIFVTVNLYGSCLAFFPPQFKIISVKYIKID